MQAAAPRPCTTRMPIRISMVGANIAPSPVNENSNAPNNITGRRPMLSEMVPAPSWPSPSMTRKPDNTSCASSPVAIRSARRSGMAGDSSEMPTLAPETASASIQIGGVARAITCWLKSKLRTGNHGRRERQHSSTVKSLYSVACIVLLPHKLNLDTPCPSPPIIEAPCSWRSACCASC